jgi:hypothetical protein
MQARQLWARSLWMIPCVLSVWLMGCQINPPVSGAAVQPAVDSSEALTAGDRNASGESAPETVSEIVPETVVDRVLQRASEQSGSAVDSLSIVQATAETWSDGCLGLGGPAELCMMALVDGWWIQVTDGEDVWSYRTDATGQAIRRVPADLTH